MSGRPSRDVTLARAYMARTGCAPAEAAAKYGVSVRRLQELAAAAGEAKPRGRPRKAP